MQATGSDMAMLARYCAPRPVAIELRLVRLGVPPAWRPALMRSLHLLMGTSVGAVFGAAAGHGVLWALIGIGLGVALNRIQGRGSA